jgi:DHA1 family bicyclomycin/chloramphenicol resistance-like MFS transporter
MSPTSHVTTAASASAMSPALIVLLLSLLLGLQPITTDLYLPALPALTEGFGASMSQAQLTLTALLLSFGVSQLVWGPLSDRFGRRPVLLWGMAAFVAASIGSAFAPSMELLIIWRTIQGAAMGAGVMCARAVVRDLYLPLEGARAMSKGLTGLGVIACISAPLGGLLSDLFSWRATLLAVAVFGAAALAMIALRFEETVPPSNRRVLHPLTLARTWLQILRHPTFLAFSALSAASYGGLFTFLATSSFVFIKVLGLTKTHYGLLMFSMSLSYIAGTFMCRRLLVKFGVRRTVALAAVLTLTGGTLMAVLALLGSTSPWYGPWAIMVPFYLFMLGHGVHQPCGQSGAIGPFPQAAGTASALNGFLMMLAAFFMGGWLGTHMDGTVFPMVYGLWFWSALIALSAWTLVQRHGQTPQH